MARLLRWGKTLPGRHHNQRQEGARFALVVLSCVNLLNFADRYIPSAVKSLLQRDLQLTDLQTSLPTTGMVLVYMVTAMLIGSFADKQILDRRTLLAAGVAFWSLATALTGFARSFTEFFIYRSLVGVGEAVYITIAPPMIADYYPVRDRNMAMMVFNISAPLGGALGFIVGSAFGGWFSWRVAFFVFGFPGMLVALLLTWINDPCPGVNDPKALTEGIKADASSSDRPGSYVSEQGFWADMGDIVRVPHWMVCMIGMTACCFTVGALSDWLDTLMVRTVPGSTVEEVGLLLGAATLLGGIGGTFLGSQVAQQLEGRWTNAFLRVPAVFQVPATVFFFLAVNGQTRLVDYSALLLGEICFFTYLAPVNTMLINCMPVHLRARSMGLSIFVSHVLGDVISPPIIGAISDVTGSLRAGMQLAWAMTLVACVTWGVGSYVLEALPGEPSEPEGSSPACEPPPTLSSLLCGGVPEVEEEEEAASTPLPRKGRAPGYGAAA